MLKIKSRFIFSLLFTLITTLSHQCFAQDIKKDSSHLDIVQDARIKELMAKKIEINEKTKGKLKGFRVQIYSGSESDKAKEIKAKFSQKYNDVPAYFMYELPNFKVRIGDYRTKLEAQKFLKTISGDFPNSFVVQGEIELPKVE